MVPVVGPAVAELAKSDAVTTLREVATDGGSNSGDLTEVYSAFVSDLQDSAKLDNRTLVIVLDGIDSRLGDPAVRSLVERVLPKVSNEVAVVASARDVDIDLGTSFAQRRVKWLTRISDDAIRDELRNRMGLPDPALDQLAAVIDGSADRLKNIVALYRASGLNPADDGEVSRFLAQAPAWADTGQVYQALELVKSEHQQLALALSALRWVNTPLLEHVAAVISPPDKPIESAELLTPQHRPPWLVPDRWGWRISVDSLRRSMAEGISPGKSGTASQSAWCSCGLPPSSAVGTGPCGPGDGPG